MKKNLLLFVCCVLFVSASLQAQDATEDDTLKIDFMRTGTGAVEEGWEQFDVQEKIPYVGGAKTFTKFGGASVSVEPVWITSDGSEIVNDNVRPFSRDTAQWNGSLANMIADFIAASNFGVSADCNALAVELSGLPAGYYNLTSYHHDIGDQFASFTIETKVNSTVVEEISEPLMTSHGADTTSNSYNVNPIPTDLLEKHVAKTTTGISEDAWDTVTTYTSANIYIQSVTDVLTVTYTNTMNLTSDGHNHSMKFLIINGIILSHNTTVGVKDVEMSQNFNISNTNGLVTISGQNLSEVAVYSLAGSLVKSILDVGNMVKIEDLNNGIYIAKIGFRNGESVSTKVIVF